MDIVLLATAWGPRFGGINAFNQDFAIGLSAKLEQTGRVFCAVPDPTAVDFESAKKDNVILVPVLNKRHKDEFDDSWTYDVLAWLDNEYPGAHGDWWVGHDVVSGEAAIRGASLAGGAAALIHHMNYIDYYAFKHDDAPSADAKHQRQRALFEKSALHFAVGPLLQRSCESLSGREVTLLVPGFPEVPASRVSEKSIIAITFGRMEAVDDRIKQGQLAVAAFGEAIKYTTSSSTPVECLTAHPRMYVIGLEEDARTEAQDLIKSAEKRAGRVLNVLPLSFDRNREELLKRLSEVNLALMLSWHEGFGLTGWEAIAAEIPLILSKHSGLFELISEYLGGAGTGCLTVIDIQGQRGEAGEDNFTPDDLKQVSTAILGISARLAHYRNNARTLKKLLIEQFGCTWRNTASQFLDALPELQAPANVELERSKARNLPALDQSQNSDANGERASDAQYGPFHRLASPSQTDELASLQEAEGRIYGISTRTSLTPRVQAYQGPLPPNAAGVEFTTPVPPSVKTDFHASWYRSQDGAPTSTPRGEEYFAIPVKITRRVTLSYGIDAVLDNPLIAVVDRHDDMGSYAVKIGKLNTIVVIELGRFRTQEITKFQVSHAIHTPLQIGPYRTSRPFADTWTSALRNAVSGLTTYYGQAIQAGHNPEEGWLVPYKLP